MFFQTVLGAGLELVKVPAGPGHADNGHVKVAAFYHGLQRREDFFVCQVAGGAEKHQGVAMICVHDRTLLDGFFQMSAKAEAHRGENLVLKIRLAAGGEALIERRGQNRHRHAFVDCGLDGPAALTRI